MRKVTGNEQETSSPPRLVASAGTNAEDRAAIVLPAPRSSGSEPRAATPPVAHLTGDPTCTATPTSSPGLQPLVSTPLRSPDRYQILGEHGRGGIGRISRAYDRELGRDVAIKELISRGQIAEARFMREALITARLEHPGIVPVHEAGRWPDGTPFYAMKLVSGRPLRDLIAERTTVDQRIGLLHHVIAVADAIAYAHDRNIIHRDLKPANVIVGDFGETIVIDWGLAKDLSAVDEPAISGDPSRHADDHDLTVTGAVVGTPIYMPPEQERGEHVDQRADVFAIGAILWELCSLHKVPPTNPRQRHRLLRRAGIDKDLIVIIDNALAPIPTQRYSDAGALAADLKAFTSGARIAARHYSLVALLAHWTSRHRRLALSIAGITALAIATMIFYVRSIATERDRADTSEADATRSRAIAEQSLNELTLKHAELLLQRDPTATVTLLASYHGPDTTRRMQLLAEARGRGIAREVLRPHSDTVHFLAGLPDDSIVSLGEDHRVRRTINGATTTLASDASHVVHLAYSPVRRLLAYATLQHRIALLDLQTNAIQRTDIVNPSALAMAPDGSQLAALSKSGALTVWDMTLPVTPRYHMVIAPADSVAFVGSDRLALLRQSNLQILTFENARTSSLAISPTAIHSRGDDIAVGTSQGALLIVSSELSVLAKLQACSDSVTAVQFVPHRDLLAFVCDEGGVGIARYVSTSKELVKTAGFQTQAGPFLLAVDDSGEHLLTSSDRDAYLHDLDSGITTVLRGQAAFISTIAAPTNDFSHLLTGDVNGTVRIWDFDRPHARVLARVRGRCFGSQFAPDGSALAVYGTDPAIHIIRMLDGSTSELQGHAEAIRGLRYSPDGQLLVSFSWDETARLWHTRDETPLGVFDGHRALVQDGAFIDGGRAVTIGDDGHLFIWRPGEADVVPAFVRDEPLITLQVLSGTNDIMVQDGAGAVWKVRPGSEPKQIRSADEAGVTNLSASSDGKFLAVGQESGAITVYSTVDWYVSQRVALKGTIARIEFDPSNRDMLINSEDDLVYLISLDARRPAPWASMQVNAHDVRYSPDGELIAITTSEGGTWFYSRREASWHYVHDHRSEVCSGQFSPDGFSFVSIDSDGTVVIREVLATLSRPTSITRY